MRSHPIHITVKPAIGLCHFAILLSRNVSVLMALYSEQGAGSNLNLLPK